MKKTEESKHMTKKRKIIRACNSVLLYDNRLSSVRGIRDVLNKVLYNYGNLRKYLLLNNIYIEWLDLSFNKLVTIDLDLLSCESLKTIYLHCNLISSFK